MSLGLCVFAMLEIALKESLKIIKFWFCFPSTYSKAFRMAIASAEYMEHSVGSLYVIT